MRTYLSAAIHENFESYSKDSPDKLHEAGYDAFCTGVCFARMAHRLCKYESIAGKILVEFYTAQLNISITMPRGSSRNPLVIC